MFEKGDEITQATKDNITLESKFIANRDLYRHLFQRLSESMKKDYRSLTMFQTTLLDRSFFRRDKLVKGESASKN
jgi:hypothetical protein